MSTSSFPTPATSDPGDGLSRQPSNQPIIHSNYSHISSRVGLLFPSPPLHARTWAGTASGCAAGIQRTCQG